MMILIIAFMVMTGMWVAPMLIGLELLTPIYAWVWLTSMIVTFIASMVEIKKFGPAMALILSVMLLTLFSLGFFFPGIFEVMVDAI